MSIFQKSVLNEYLKNLDETIVAQAYSRFQKNFNIVKIEEIKKLKEEEYQDGFLRDIFVDVFGYTFKPEENYNLAREYKNVSDSKKADGAILKNGNVIAVIELKSAKTKDLNSIKEQAFNYKNEHEGCKYVITSNFQKIRLYVEYSNEFEEFDLFDLSQDDFKTLYLLLNKESVFNDIPSEIKQKTIFREENISKQLYKDYSSFKKRLFENLVKNNPEQDKLTLFKKSQKLIDRFLFILFAEDRGLLPSNSISRIIQRFETLKNEDNYKPLYEVCKQYFGYLNKGRMEENIPAYNGGLFYEDNLLDKLIIEDEVLKDDLLRLSGYDFNTDVDVNILGHIFEHSLSEIEEITAEIEGIEKDKSKSKRKKDGVFYTPKYITQYIVENTIGTLCTEKRKELNIFEIEFDESFLKKDRKLSKQGLELYEKLEEYKKWLLSLKIVDPACGSGAFLNQALNFLISEHQFVIDMETELQQGQGSLFSVETAILENNLYGVDINEESVEIAKLSLWLRTAQKGRKLSILSNNIKCGNSLIDDPEVAGDKAFNWEKEFPEVFKNGGFDVVIGNPPYVDIKGLDKKITDYLFNVYRSSNNRINLYASFIEKSLAVFKKTGVFSFIIPSSLLTQESYKELRNILLNEVTIKSIIRLPNESFGGSAGEVKVDTIILTFKCGVFVEDQAEIIVYKGFDRISDISKYNSDFHFFINTHNWKLDENYIFRINTDDSALTILSKCRNGSQRLIECASFCLGLTPYDKYKGHTEDQIVNRVFHSDKKKDETFKKLLAGNDIKRYFIKWGEEEWISYGDWLGAPRENRFFTENRILVKQIIDWSDKRIWAASTNEELYNTQNAFNIIPNSNFDIDYLLAIINSKLMSFYHRKEFLEEYKDRFQKILIKDAKEFPIKLASMENQQIFVEKAKSIRIITDSFWAELNKLGKYIIHSYSINTLSRKLQNWYELEFGDFIKELNKEIKKSGREKLTKMEEMEWMELFETKKAEVLKLKEEIDKTDKEIDNMVYELYGLTPEEIEIVEGSCL